MPTDTTTPTFDLLEELDRLRAIAENARKQLDAGQVINGRCALRKIETHASDVIRWTRAEATR